MVGQEALGFVWNSNQKAMSTTRFFRLVYGDWEPKVNEDANADEEHELIERYMQEDVGWIKIPYDEVHSIPRLELDGWQCVICMIGICIMLVLQKRRSRVENRY